MKNYANELKPEYLGKLNKLKKEFPLTYNQIHKGLEVESKGDVKYFVYTAMIAFLNESKIIHLYDFFTK